MQITDLNKNIEQILNDKYIVPLYQRNFAWGEEEISRLLEDIYESFKKNVNGNYFIGSLVVLKRKNGDFEVIDGQQRLTAITLITKILGLSEISQPRLFYDSRPEVESFFTSFYRTGKTDDVTFDYRVSHLINAVDFINQTKLNVDSKENITIAALPDKEKTELKKFFTKNVIMVRVEIPEDTDVANYFEIMNNRGEQLQKHEILKAKLMDKIKNGTGSHSINRQKLFAKIWDACSQMDTHVQKLFRTHDRSKLFGNYYNQFIFDEKDLIDPNELEKQALHNNNNDSIDGILQAPKTNEDDAIENGDIDDEGNDKSIIDFPNFLMHVFKLTCTEIYQNSTRDVNPQSISLNEKDLLHVFDVIENAIDPMYFIARLLFYRVVFDRYVIKATSDEMAEDEFEWSLEQPYKYENNSKSSLKYKNTFIDQGRAIKCLSMLQVSFRSRIYKNWLQEILSWFSYGSKFEMDIDVFQNKLDVLATNLFESGDDCCEIQLKNYYSKGTDTPHFIFNYIDYLYWVESENDRSRERFNFVFRYRNSVEHHRPQSVKQNIDDKFIDCLGNLCLISKSSNSKMNNEEPYGKAVKYYSDKLPPKRKIMYEITRNSPSTLKWGEVEIKSHYKEVVLLLRKRKDILGIQKEV